MNVFIKVDINLYKYFLKGGGVYNILYIINLYFYDIKIICINNINIPFISFVLIIVLTLILRGDTPAWMSVLYIAGSTEPSHMEHYERKISPNHLLSSGREQSLGNHRTKKIMTSLVASDQRGNNKGKNIFREATMNIIYKAMEQVQSAL